MNANDVRRFEMRYPLAGFLIERATTNGLTCNALLVTFCYK